VPSRWADRGGASGPSAHRQVYGPPSEVVTARSRGSAPLAGALTALRALATDRRSSALELAGRALELLDLWQRGLSRRPSAAVEREARRIERILSAVQPAMGTFRSWADSWRTGILGGPSPPQRPTIALWIRARRRELLSEPLALRARVREQLPPGGRFLTFSRSASVAGALLALPARRRPRLVLAVESLPGGEGRRLARELRRGGIPTRVVPDGKVEAALTTADLVLVGADAIDPRGNLTHKVGTRALAARAHRLHVPFVVVAGRSKWVPAERRARLPSLFDRTPARWITEYWTDRGVWHPPRRASARLARNRTAGPKGRKRSPRGLSRRLG
jgi:translation initiation factor 2B subunit (eIF-2B alpha/beta/delta family)